MKDPRNLDEVLKEWPFDARSISVRLVKGSDDRDVIQMRIELGLLQLETSGRPDGERPFGEESFYGHLLQLEIDQGDQFELSDEQCFECDREFVQFYHRRVCWLAMQEYDKAVLDADHTLGLMNFCSRHSSDEQWVLSHEQYRPFVMYHRIQAHAMGLLVNDAAEDAIESINRGLTQLRELYKKHGLDEDFDEDELVSKLVELRESLRDQFEIGRTLREQLSDAVASEQYELAARIRDQIQQKRQGPR